MISQSLSFLDVKRTIMYNPPLRLAEKRTLHPPPGATLASKKGLPEAPPDAYQGDYLEDFDKPTEDCEDPPMTALAPVENNPPPIRRRQSNKPPSTQEGQ
jgi:hypothetical protein